MDEKKRKITLVEVEIDDDFIEQARKILEPNGMGPVFETDGNRKFFITSHYPSPYFSAAKAICDKDHYLNKNDEKLYAYVCYLLAKNESQTRSRMTTSSMTMKLRPHSLSKKTDVNKRPSISYKKGGCA